MLGGFLPFFTHHGERRIRHPQDRDRGEGRRHNTTPTVAYRGAGRPEATAAIERAMDLFAAEIGKDPVDVRRRTSSERRRSPRRRRWVPSTTPVTTSARSISCSKRRTTARCGPSRRPDASEVTSTTRHRRGGLRRDHFGPNPGTKEWGKVEINRDGTATIYSGSMSHGQSHATAFAMLVTEQTGIPMDKIDLVQGDTDRIPKGGGTNASKSLQAGGSAVYVSAAKVVDQARQLAAELLEASVDDVVLDKVGAQFHVQGTPAKTVSWAEVVHAAGDDGLSATTDDVLAASSFPSEPPRRRRVDNETGGMRWRGSSRRRLRTILKPTGRRTGVTRIAQGLARRAEEVRFEPTETDHRQLHGLRDHPAAELQSYELIRSRHRHKQPLVRKVSANRRDRSKPARRAGGRRAVAFGVRTRYPTTSRRCGRPLHQTS